LALDPPFCLPKEKIEMSGFELNDDDVVFTGNTTSPNFGLSSTFKISELVKAAIKWVAGTGGASGHANPFVNWFTVDGVKCQILRSQGGGWKSGKLIFKLEFIPDDPESFVKDSLLKTNKPGSPLDDLRSQLNPE
jgi:KGK domain